MAPAARRHVLVAGLFGALGWRVRVGVQVRVLRVLWLFLAARVGAWVQVLEVLGLLLTASMSVWVRVLPVAGLLPAADRTHG